MFYLGLLIIHNDTNQLKTFANSLLNILYNVVRDLCDNIIVMSSTHLTKCNFNKLNGQSCI